VAEIDAPTVQCFTTCPNRIAVSQLPADVSGECRRQAEADPERRQWRKQADATLAPASYSTPPTTQAATIWFQIRYSKVNLCAPEKPYTNTSTFAAPVAANSTHGADRLGLEIVGLHDVAQDSLDNTVCQTTSSLMNFHLVVT
jgi:hypothetical protein